MATHTYAQATSAPNSGSPWSDAHKHKANLDSPPPCSQHPIHSLLNNAPSLDCKWLLPRLLLHTRPWRCSGSQPCYLDLGCDETLESVFWGTTSPICRAQPSGTNQEVEKRIEVCDFAPRKKCPEKSMLLESLPSHQTCYQTLSHSSPPTWSTKPNPNQRTKQPTKQETNQSFTEISTPVCVLQAVLLVHNKHSSTHKQASECNYSLWDCQVSMYYLKSKKNLKMLDDTSTSKKTDLCFKSWKKILFYFLKCILCKNLRCSHLN